jgi:hypothetical protein
MESGLTVCREGSEVLDGRTEGARQSGVGAHGVTGFMMDGRFMGSPMELGRVIPFLRRKEGGTAIGNDPL